MFRLLVCSLFLNMLATSAFAQWTPQPTGRAKEILRGNWQSCLEDDGETYTERAYEYRPSPSQPVAWEFHMGPHDEFALFRGSSPMEQGHDTRLNLLRPAYHVFDVETFRGDRTWTALNLWINVVAAGGSRTDCQSFYVLIERTDLGQKSARAGR